MARERGSGTQQNPHTFIDRNVHTAAPWGACVLGSVFVHLRVYFYTGCVCVCILECERLRQLDGSWQIRAHILIEAFVFWKPRDTQPLLLFFYTSVPCCLFPHLYLQLHRSADIMRTWVPNEMKWGKTRLLSASFSGQLLKTAGAVSLTGPLT